MTTQKELNKKFETLNRKYVKLSNQLDKIGATSNTWDLEDKLEEIQQEMCKISAQLEEMTY
jgi:uncharacterized protein YukE